jgi:hypothetical protein
MDPWNRVYVNSGRDERAHFNARVRVCPTDVGFNRWIDEELAPRVERALDDRSQRLADIRGAAPSIPGDRIEFGG